MQEQHLITLISDMLQASDQLVSELRAQRQDESALRRRVDHIRSGIGRLVETTQTLQIGHDDASRERGSLDGERLRSAILSTWGYATFLRQQLAATTVQKRRLADYAEGLREEIQALRELLVDHEPSR